MTVEQMKWLVAKIPEKYNALQVKFHDTYTDTTSSFSNRKPVFDRFMNEIVFSSPPSKYSPTDR